MEAMGHLLARVVPEFLLSDTIGGKSREPNGRPAVIARAEGRHKQCPEVSGRAASKPAR